MINNHFKYIKDSLKTMRRLERLTETMKKEDCDPILIEDVFKLIKAISDQFCLSEIFKVCPELENDKEYLELMDYLANQVPNGNQTK
jgi:hypothetical protein